jgi:hypothetical protein
MSPKFAKTLKPILELALNVSLLSVIAVVFATSLQPLVA